MNLKQRLAFIIVVLQSMIFSGCTPVLGLGPHNPFNGSSPETTIQRYEGNGSFQSPITHNISTDVSTFALSDFNEDGKIDLITSEYHAAQIEISTGDGLGNFSSIETIAIPVPGIIQTYDFNKDSKMDFVIGSQNGPIYTFLGRGNGTFETPLIYDVGVGIASIRATDFNLDGNQDIAVSAYGTSTMNILLGVGDGSFVTSNIYPIANDSYYFSVDDLNGDGFIDIAAGSYTEQKVSLLLGHGDATFTSSELSTPWPTQGLNVSIGDFDNDTKLDLVLAFFNDKSFIFMKGIGNGTFLTGVEVIQSTAQPETSCVSVADINGDANLDLLVNNYDDSSFSVYMGKGDGTFETPITTSASGTNQGSVFYDINGDNKLDVIIGANPGTGYQVFLGN